MGLDKIIIKKIIKGFITDCTNVLDYDAYLKNPDLCFCMYVNAGMYEEFNDYLIQYKNEKIKEYNEKHFLI